MGERKNAALQYMGDNAMFDALPGPGITDSIYAKYPTQTAIPEI